jgi:hypothetical protein
MEHDPLIDYLRLKNSNVEKLPLSPQNKPVVFLLRPLDNTRLAFFGATFFLVRPEMGIPWDTHNP